jgi:hypothetical protein
MWKNVMFYLKVPAQFVLKNLAISQKASCMPEVSSWGITNSSRSVALQPTIITDGPYINCSRLSLLYSKRQRKKKKKVHDL